MFGKKFFSIFLGALLLSSAVGFGQTHNGKELVEFEGIPGSSKMVPGQPFPVALEMKMAEGWHTYWTFSGEAGLATTIQWDLPEGIRAGKIVSPLPVLKTEETGMKAYSFQDEVTHVVYLYPSPEWPMGETLEISAKVDWLVCEESCIPGNAEFSFSVETAESMDVNARVQKAQESIPGIIPWDEEALVWRWAKTENHLHLLLGDLPDGDQQIKAFYPLPPDGVFIEIPQAPEPLEKNAELLELHPDYETVISVKVNSGLDNIEHLDGLLVLHDLSDTEKRTGYLLPKQPLTNLAYHD